jgi:hypothetical protein
VFHSPSSILSPLALLPEMLHPTGVSPAGHHQYGKNFVPA